MGGEEEILGSILVTFDTYWVVLQLQKENKIHITHGTTFNFSFKSLTLNMDLNFIAKDVYSNNCLGNQKIIKEENIFNTDLEIFRSFALCSSIFSGFFFSSFLSHLNTLLSAWSRKNQIKVEQKATNKRSSLGKYKIYLLKHEGSPLWCVMDGWGGQPGGSRD